jgi:hypothetical protein
LGTHAQPTLHAQKQDVRNLHKAVSVAIHSTAAQKDHV